MESQINNSVDTAQDEVSLLELFFHYFSYWKWFVISLVICLSLAFVYLRYTTKQYTVFSKVLIKDEKRGQTGFDWNAFSDLGLTPQMGSFDNEIEILNSQSLMQEVVDSLKLGVAYFKEGRIKKEEIYKNTPIFVNVSDQTDLGSFILDKKEDGSFELKASKEDFTASFAMNDTLVSPWGILSFRENSYGSAEFPVEVIIKHPKDLPFVNITPINKQTTVVDISTITSVPEKGKDIINVLVGIYNQKTIDDKNYVANNTITFLNGRINVIFGELSDAEKEVEAFKKSKGLTDMATEAQMFLTSQNEYSKKISDTDVQLSILRDIKSFIRNPQNMGNVAPSNVGVTDPTILSLIHLYNETILEKNITTRGMTANNARIREYDEKIALLRDNLVKGIEMSESGMQTSLRELRSQEGMYLARTLGLSTQERESRELYRQQSLKETLYVYLSQKREETALSRTLATPNALVIDAADYSPIPVKPKSKIIGLAALLMGIIIPVLIIYIKDLFDNRIHTKEQLTRIVKAPFIGEIPKSKIEKAFPTLNARSIIAEKFRIAISNLSFVTPPKIDSARIILVTSSFSGEGKSFFSQNLAMSLATTGNKTLLIDMDMRKSVLNKTLAMNPVKGIAMYLADPSIIVDDIIDKSKTFHKNLDIIPIRTFPPNVAELLASNRLDMLFEESSKEYDYIIVDTAPIGLVADAYRINQFVDASIYVARAEYTYKSQLADLQTLYKENKLKNMTVILNAASPKKGYYGYKDNGYYGEDA